MSDEPMEQTRSEQPEVDVDIPRAIMESAKRLLTEKGWEGLTVSAISKDAAVYRAAISYHYGSKEGLVAALLDHIIVHTAQTLMHRVPDASSEERVKRTVSALDMLGGTDAQMAFFDAFTHLLRDPSFSPRLKQLYREVIALSAESLGDGAYQDLEPFAAMVVAFTDGLIIQQLIEPERDFEPMIDAFVALFTPAVEAIIRGHEASAIGDGGTTIEGALT
jgi:AcrR family transcriptional regulator